MARPDEEHSMDDTVLTRSALMEHWLGHRRLTRRTLLAFPDEGLFAHHAPGMRPFAAMVAELVTWTAPTVRGAADGNWRWPAGTRGDLTTKAALLDAFDQDTAELERLLPGIPEARFAQIDEPVAGRREPVIASLLYALDNEVHHRAQGFVYLRDLGIDPPAFEQR
jgi:uncharacterized damage-inducible protein DinB